MIESKREYKQKMARVEALPKDYQYVFKKIRAICGCLRRDLAAFCDELLRSASTYTENWREALNHDIQKISERKSKYMGNLKKYRKVN